MIIVLFSLNAVSHEPTQWPIMSARHGLDATRADLMPVNAVSHEPTQWPIMSARHGLDTTWADVMPVKSARQPSLVSDVRLVTVDADG